VKGILVQRMHKHNILHAPRESRFTRIASRLASQIISISPLANRKRRFLTVR
jgi:hypothetical protein